MKFSSSLRQSWCGNLRGDVLAGLVVALALIPEAIAFSIIAGVDPRIGLYAAFCICVTIAFAGGRPGMISAATGAMALLMIGLVKEHGVPYLLAATLLTGVLQILAGLFKLGALMRFVSRSVITGFVNALAILIFMAQLPELIGVPVPVYPLVALGLLLIYGLPWLSRRSFPGIGLWLLVLGAALTAGSMAPWTLLPVAVGGAAALLLGHRWTRGLAVPPPLVAIVLLTGLALYFGIHVPTVGDKGQLPDRLPSLLLPSVPWTLETLRIVFPVSATMAVVGLLESMMTAQIVDDMTDTPSDKNRECVGQGVANIVSGLFGGMAGCAMIGQSVINVKSGGRGRLSALVAGSVLLLLVVFAGAWVRQIPMAALVAVMIMVSVGTFNWRSLVQLRTHPTSSSVVMLGTVAVTVATHDLARGVLTGVLLSALFFARKVGRMLDIARSEDPDGGHTYRIRGQLFFASAGSFAGAFDFAHAPARVTLDLSQAHVWDISAIGALDQVVMKFRRHGAQVHVVGLNPDSAAMVGRLGRHQRDDVESVPLH
ncbi:SulP family inorganic anion transporter [Xanthomonas sp. A2111]|uniref:SulP family inorganic anion transporter n=1 Tax=Xanthomonas hawaiiensis TaxID=3003247 RepID=A0ABU2I5M3_9XANT|nr:MULTISPECIES: SulP family inorganic anion transporter [unclassified Xanthomonas]MBO9829734.1 SulP family inorganic anion transporter [Xanthomonas sp. A2111]MBO9873373.1 SulP family inorganic anion transporter [Xanthomonas sp. D-93]MDS9993424.1 SulP family inorganic anion transporter [Xanthomonas sp. A2111]WNH45159.1 SulP family inorganic anion transporter [Xanthomonas sp. A6251]